MRPIYKLLCEYWHFPTFFLLSYFSKLDRLTSSAATESTTLHAASQSQSCSLLRTFDSQSSTSAEDDSRSYKFATYFAKIGPKKCC